VRTILRRIVLAPQEFQRLVPNGNFFKTAFLETGRSELQDGPKNLGAEKNQLRRSFKIFKNNGIFLNRGFPSGPEKQYGCSARFCWQWTPNDHHPEP
jgi:hypothetical protein